MGTKSTAIIVPEPQLRRKGDLRRSFTGRKGPGGICRAATGRHPRAGCLVYLPQKRTGMMDRIFPAPAAGYIAAPTIAQALCVPTLDLHARIQAAHISGADRCRRPTYALAHTPGIVEQSLEVTPLPRIWFVMDCGSENLGSADHYNRQLAQRREPRPMGTAPIHTGELHCHVLSPRDPARGRPSWTAPPLLSSRPLTVSRPAEPLPPAKICTTVI